MNNIFSSSIDHNQKVNKNETNRYITPDNIISSRIVLNQSPASVSELTDTNSSLVTELQEENQE